MFSLYVSPRHEISPMAIEITGLKFALEDGQMYYHGVPVESVCIRQALVQFLEYIQKKSRPVLVGHNIFNYDIPILQNLMREFKLLSSFNASTYGCIDTYKLAKRVIPKQDIVNYKQQTLVEVFLGISYAAHNSE